MKAILAIISFVLGLVTRYFRIKDDPDNRYTAAKNENATIIEKSDAAAINRKLDGLTDRLRQPRDGD